MERITDTTKKALREEVSPLLVGLRNEIRALNATLEELRKERAQADARTVDVSVLNPVSEVRFTNKQVDARPNIDTLAEKTEKQTERIERALGNFGEYMKSAGWGLGKVLTELREREYSVDVQNEVSARVVNLGDIPQPQFPKSVRIENSDPRDAIPVVLTTKDRKRFYEVLTTLSTAHTQTSLDIESISANMDALEELTGSALVDAFGEDLAVPPATQVTLASFIVPAGKAVQVKGVDATGDRDGLFTLYRNGTKVAQWRNSWCARNIVSRVETRASAGQTVALRVTNLNSGVGEYSGHIFGYTLSV